MKNFLVFKKFIEVLFWTYLYLFLVILKCVNCNMLIKLIKKIKLFSNNQNLDARFWVQKLLLRKSLNSLKH